MTDTNAAEPTRIAFVCVRNAGRSQMSAAFAERERDRRDLNVEILSGGTRPAESVHEGVIEAMAEVGLDLTDRTPREIGTAELRTCDYAATMGCSTLDVDAIRDDVDVRDWALADPGGADLDRVREIRDEIEGRVAALFDEVE
ncbi:low molecular weight phosphatase family protein [Haloplanus rallus]|jgi:protein-tyrosine-phosphatase|uniref:Low molecular weight phosphatase family protein n=1 Tax=Haloplanus rallus TaxID=1816183 RepID=A0A6B9FBC1_9EURY|nr:MULTISPECIES: low molecular weight phosphatase family protein [Haloplanus]QGX96137.1 low molecular weight phosphatase family protein [Haloplanus rallus]